MVQRYPYEQKTTGTEQFARHPGMWLETRYQDSVISPDPAKLALSSSSPKRKGRSEILPEQTGPTSSLPCSYSSTDGRVPARRIHTDGYIQCGSDPHENQQTPGNM